MFDLRRTPLAQLKATVVGGSAVKMWATLALTAMSFSIGFCIGLGLWLHKGGRIWRHLRLPGRVWALAAPWTILQKFELFFIPLDF